MDGRQYKGKVDVLVWGFPCTSYSIAGLRRGMDDEKTGDLFHQGLRPATSYIVTIRCISGFQPIRVS